MGLPAEVRVILSRRLDTVRAALGWDRAEMARRFEVSGGKISETLNGKSDVTTAMLYYLRNEVGVSMEWFFDGRGSMFLENEHVEVKYVG